MVVYAKSPKGPNMRTSLKTRHYSSWGPNMEKVIDGSNINGACLLIEDKC